MTTTPPAAIAIRPMQSADIAAVTALVLATPLWQRHGVDGTGFAARLAQGLDAAATILVAWATDSEDAPEEIAGFIWYVVDGAFVRSGYIMLIGIAPAWQRRGMGRLLMDAAEGELRRHVADIFLLVSDFNEPAHRFYETLGYTRVGAIPDYVTPGIAELIYRKRVGGSTE